jgi:hypothetical protein
MTPLRGRPEIAFHAKRQILLSQSGKLLQVRFPPIVGEARAAKALAGYHYPRPA